MDKKHNQAPELDTFTILNPDFQAMDGEVTISSQEQNVEPQKEMDEEQ
ncbi:hypothetical protein SAMN05216389_1061 [Oceanobacillus limi]|uniref:Uncharacterized protein n=1 Tax=Oceanobacillus limi TaxID=930131 RepID=A0A1I0C2S4_9BACI|nr:hypothetical protein [Oceanobacillus limi]SET13748.1 hypothetical protein SAMN05216389_1061 [Oceanobacillus limi]